MGQVPLKRIRGLAIASMVLSVIVALLGVLELLARRGARGDARAYQAGDLTTTEFTRNVAGFVLMNVAIAIVTIAAAVITIVFIARVASNLRALHRGTTWGPGWAVGGWFAPPLLYVIPTLFLREYWQASDPDVPVGGNWKARPSTVLPLIWLMLFSVVPLVLNIVQATGEGFNPLGGTEDQLADQILADMTTSVISAAATALAAVVWAVYVRSLSDRHRRLTGEATRAR